MPDDLTTLTAILGRIETESNRRFDALERRLDGMVTATIPVSAYEERSRAIQADIASLRAGLAEESATRKAVLAQEAELRKSSVKEIITRLDVEKAQLGVNLRWALGGIVGALGVGVAEFFIGR